MVPADRMVAFAALAAVIIAVPGPSVLFTVSRALTVGRRAAFLTVVGNEIGLLAQVAATALGTGVLVEDSAMAFAIVKYAGAAYIVYLGVQAIRHRRSVADAIGGQLPAVTPKRALRDGILVGVTNPKTIVVFVSVMPGFADPAAGDLPMQLLLLGMLFPIIALVLDSIWAIAAGTLRAWLAREPKRLAAIGGTGGLVMIGVGAGIALTGRKE